MLRILESKKAKARRKTTLRGGADAPRSSRETALRSPHSGTGRFPSPMRMGGCIDLEVSCDNKIGVQSANVLDGGIAYLYWGFKL